MDPIHVPTPSGPARVHLRPTSDPRGGLVLGHGAGGGITAPDLVAAAHGGLAAGFTVALVEQPYRVAGRRAPAPAAQLDAAFSTVVARLAEVQMAGVSLVLGGRSLGARVACRTAGELDPIGVLCLAFPLLPPARAGSGRTPVSRLPELDAVTVRTLVIQGDQDRFGIPPEAPGRAVLRVPGDHSLRRSAETLTGAVADWLASL